MHCDKDIYNDLIDLLAEIKLVSCKAFQYESDFGGSRELSLAKTKLQESIFWLRSLKEQYESGDKP